MKRKYFFSLLGGLLTAATMGMVDKDAQPVAADALDLTQAALWRGADDDLIFEVRTRGPMDPQRVRILLLNRDAAVTADRDTSAWMVERGGLYRRTPNVSGWAWDEVMTLLSVAASNVWIVRVPNRVTMAQGGWIVETFDMDGCIADRLPNDGSAHFIRDEIPVWSPRAPAASVDLARLYEQAPVALTVRMETELKAIRWERMEQVPPLSYPLAMTAAAPFHVSLRDAASGHLADCTFTSAWCGGHWTRWDGSALGVQCSVMVATSHLGGAQVNVFLRSAEERRVAATVTIPLGGEGWQWWEPSGFRPLDSCSTLVSDYPFAVLGQGSAIWILSASPDEPRAIRIFAEGNGENARLNAASALALTRSTSNFPLRASMSLLLRTIPWKGEHAFFAAVSELHRSGLLGGPSRLGGGTDIASGLKLFGYFVVPIASGLLHSSADFEAALELSAGLPGWVGERARAWQWGGLRDADGALVCRIVNGDVKVALCDGWLDPDMRVTTRRPISPAMQLWHEIEHALQKRDSETLVMALPDLSQAQYDQAALGVADYPCAFETNSLQPYLTAGAACFEFLQLVAPRIRAAGKTLALQVVGGLDAFPLRFGDAFVVWEGPFGNTDELAQWFVQLRVLAGRREIFVRPAVFASKPAEDGVMNYFRWGLRPFGDVPSPLAHYELLLHQMAIAGWSPEMSARWFQREAEVWVFGSPESTRFVVLHGRSSNDVPVDCSQALAKNQLCVNPLSGHVQSGEWPLCPVAAPGETSVFMILATPDGVQELQFLANWAETWPFARGVLGNVESWRREKTWGCDALVEFPSVVGYPGRNHLTLRVRNTGTQSVQLRELRVVGNVYWDAVQEKVTLAPAGETNVVCVFDGDGVPTDGVLEIQWKLEREDGSMLPCVRKVCVRKMDALAIRRAHDRLVAQDEHVVAAFEIINNTDEDQDVRVRWSGDFRSGRRELHLAPRAKQAVELSVPRGKSSGGDLIVIIEQDGRRWQTLRYELSRFPNIGKSAN